VHVFKEEIRHYYDLDSLWAQAPLLEIPEEYLWEGKKA
jgi:ribosome-associated protein